MLDLKIAVEETEVKVMTEWTAPPANKGEEGFPITEEGLERFHAKLITLRQENLDTDKLTIFSEDLVKYSGKLFKLLTRLKCLVRTTQNFRFLTKRTERWYIPSFLSQSGDGERYSIGADYGLSWWRFR